MFLYNGGLKRETECCYKGRREAAKSLSLHGWKSDRFVCALEPEFGCIYDRLSTGRNSRP